jgi:hypothetical protein
MKAYKGFNKDMTCRGFQFKEGETYHEESAHLCESGFHACEDPLDCFGYYAPANSEYHEVELDEVADEREESDSKICGKTITIGAKIDIAGICKAHIEFVKSKCKEKIEKGEAEQATSGEYGCSTSGFSGCATSGDCGFATSGDKGCSTSGEYGCSTSGDRGCSTSGDRGCSTSGYRGCSTSGEYGCSTSGDRGCSTSGEYGCSTSGDRGCSTSGDRGCSTSGDRGCSTSGYRGCSTSGDRGCSTSRGCSAVGKQGAALARGNNCKVKGGLGSILVIVEENESNYDIKDWKSAIVDGVTLKPDTWYKLEKGEFVEVEDGGKE